MSKFANKDVTMTIKKAILAKQELSIDALENYPNNSFENDIHISWLYSTQVTNYECMELSMYNLFVWWSLILKNSDGAGSL